MLLFWFFILDKVYIAIIMLSPLFKVVLDMFGIYFYDGTLQHSASCIVIQSIQHWYFA